MAKSLLRKNHIITKSNALNEMRSNNMSLQELRLLSIYMSKINPKDKSTSKVRFPVADFHAIMDVQMKNVRSSYYVDIAEKLLHKIIKIPYGGGFKAFTLFKRVIFARENEYSPYYFQIEAHEDALPLLFDLRNNYFKYELWNALRLKGKNQLRMYEVLKQYEKMGYRIISVRDLKEQLGIKESEYPNFKNFKQAVLEPCREALSELTDISYTYAPHTKNGRKIHELKFIITKNKDYKDPLALNEFIDMKKAAVDIEIIDYWDMDEDDVDPDVLSRYDARLLFFRGAVNGEFSKEQMISLCDLLSENIPSNVFLDDRRCYDYLRRKYNEVNVKDSQGEIRYSRYGYLKSLIGTK